MLPQEDPIVLRSAIIRELNLIRQAKKSEEKERKGGERITKG